MKISELKLKNMVRSVLMESLVKRKIYVLVGPPGIGKSTWIRQNISNAYIISRDDIVDEIRKEAGLKYDDMFKPEAKELNKKVNNLLSDRFKNAEKSGQDIVVDMTNMGANSRKSALTAITGFEKDFEKIAVVFDHRGKENLVRQSVRRRAKEIGDKTLGDHIVNGMMNRFEMPVPEEGFDDIIIVDPTSALNR